MKLTKWTCLLMTVICVASLFSFPASAPPNMAHAQELGEAKIYLPFASFFEPVRFDGFEDETNPVWEYKLLKDPRDGYFEHLNGKYAGRIRDNSALMVSSPGWRPRGDFKLEVDGRHLSPLRKSFNGLGLAFGGDDEWNGFYAMIIAAGGAQHFWAVARFEKVDARNPYRTFMLTNNGYRGGPGSMNNYDGTNRLMIVRIGDTIKPYNNGRALPVGDARPYAVDGRFGPNRLVGVVVTSYEFSNGEVDFDNFELTPLYGEDPDTYLPAGAQDEPSELDAPPIIVNLE